MRLALRSWQPLATLALIGACASAAALLGCAPERGAALPRNVLLITLDTTRADALGAYGRNPSVTPVLDELASESVRFAEAQSVAPLTLPAHASMLTGLVPPRHTLRDNGLWPLPDEARSLAELASDRGLATAAFVSSSVLDRSFGLAAGFATYEQPARAARTTTSNFGERSASETARSASKWLRQLPSEQRFFAWVHFFDPHVPYAPPEAFLQAAGGDAYLGEVAFVDNGVGELLATLRARGLLDDTLVIVTADHGEALGEHGEPTHGVFCYQSTLHVPLFVRYPDGFGAGSSVREPVSLVDLAPTIAEALDLPLGGETDGRSLFRVDAPAARGVYFECYAGFLDYGWSPLAGWRDTLGKYIASPTPEWFDLDADPRELRNLLPAREGQRVHFERALGELATRPALQRAAPLALDAELAAELAALGYASSGVPVDDLPSPLARVELPSPAERTAELHAFLQATAYLDQRAYRDAVPLLEAITSENPRNAAALDRLGFALMQLERFDEARQVLERRLGMPQRRSETHYNLATCFEHLGSIEAALTHLRAALALDPNSLAAREALARLKPRQ
ncbi:MAG: sulfatase-like hydrolase/transferase [Planctomycetes bacterium]|nr:sulfatase-like hydrolase/transferase [Planctomycetota bacterium]